jgi:hypothetical protein
MLDDRTTFLRWKGVIDGHEFESLKVIVEDEKGLIANEPSPTGPFRP